MRSGVLNSRGKPAVLPTSGGPTFDIERKKEQKWGEFKTLPHPTGRRSNKIKFHDVRQPLWNLICAENMRRTDLITSSKDQNPICQKLKNILTKTTLVKDVKKLSPVMQISSLEGFHSVLNHWHFKIICFSCLGIYCRSCCVS